MPEKKDKGKLTKRDYVIASLLAGVIMWPAIKALKQSYIDMPAQIKKVQKDEGKLISLREIAGENFENLILTEMEEISKTLDAIPWLENTLSQAGPERKADALFEWLRTVKKSSPRLQEFFDVLDFFRPENFSRKLKTKEEAKQFFRLREKLALQILEALKKERQTVSGDLKSLIEMLRKAKKTNLKDLFDRDYFGILGKNFTFDLMQQGAKFGFHVANLNNFQKAAGSEKLVHNNGATEEDLSAESFYKKFVLPNVSLQPFSENFLEREDKLWKEQMKLEGLVMQGRIAGDQARKRLKEIKRERRVLNTIYNLILNPHFDWPVTGNDGEHLKGIREYPEFYEQIEKEYLPPLYDRHLGRAKEEMQKIKKIEPRKNSSQARLFQARKGYRRI